VIGAASASFFLASQFLIRLSIYNPRLLKISLGRAVKCGGTIPAFALFMKLDLTSGPLSGDANLLRFREEPAAPRRAKNPAALEKLRQDFAAATRKTFVFLFFAAIGVFISSHQTELQLLATKKISPLMHRWENRSKVAQIQQNRQNYENEVNDIAK